MDKNNQFTRRRFLASATAAGFGVTLTDTPAAEEPDSAGRPPWKAGVAKVPITPRKSLWMAGFGARKKPSEGTLLELYAKALALEDQSGKRAVLVTSDLVGFPAVVAQRIAEQAQKQYGLPRDRLILNSSHTHCGPLLANPLTIWYLGLLRPEQWRDVEEYTRELEGKVVAVMGAALEGLQPARLSFAHSQASFAVNRRLKTPKGVASFVPNPDGPVDHGVPLLRVDGQDGRIRAVVFGYAAHPTCLLADTSQFNGDYALRLKKELGRDRLWVAAYSNDVFAYIPSHRVLEEGGYEGGGATVGARLPGPFAPSIEETIVRKLHELVNRVRTK